MRRTTWPRCGARCRDGHPCHAPRVWDSDKPGRATYAVVVTAVSLRARAYKRCSASVRPWSCFGSCRLWSRSGEATPPIEDHEPKE
jgi:hypothetical protein